MDNICVNGYCFSLTFVFNPSSTVYGYSSMELKPNGENEVCITLFHYSYSALMNLTKRKFLHNNLVLYYFKPILQ